MNEYNQTPKSNKLHKDQDSSDKNALHLTPKAQSKQVPEHRQSHIL